MISHRLPVDSGVHPRILHDIMDVGRCAAWLTEFASVLEVPLISWPMSRLHARNPRSPPVIHNLRQPPFSSTTPSRKLFSLPCRLRAPHPLPTVIFARLRLRVYVCTSRMRRAAPRVIIESIILSTRVIRSGIHIIRHFVVSPIRFAKERSFQSLNLSLREHCDACTWWLSRTMSGAMAESITDYKSELHATYTYILLSCVNNIFQSYLSLLLLAKFKLWCSSSKWRDIRTSASVDIVNCNPHRFIQSVICESARLLFGKQTRMYAALVSFNPTSFLS